MSLGAARFQVRPHPTYPHMLVIVDLTGGEPMRGMWSSTQRAIANRKAARLNVDPRSPHDWEQSYMPLLAHTVCAICYKNNDHAIHHYRRPR